MKKRRGKKEVLLNPKIEHPRVQEKINDTLEASVREGSVASVASGFPNKILSRTERCNNEVSWVTMAMLLLKLS